jgi:hypothetical protein
VRYTVKTHTEHQSASEPRHRFITSYRREVDGQPMFVYRCVCGYLEAAPVAGGPFVPLDHQYKPRPDVRRLVLHLNLERAHELN